jgi:hypothetical protein
MVKKKVVKKVIKKRTAVKKKPVKRIIKRKSMRKSGKKTIGKIHGFAIQFLPFSEIKNLDSEGRIKKILEIVSENNILILQGRLRPEEERKLISDTMTMIRHVSGFSGIELATISHQADVSFWVKARDGIARFISGSDFGAVTIIGPATIVKEIKRDPSKIELLLNR